MGHAELNNILVIEDEADIRKIVRISLETVGGFEVEMCSSAHSALQVLEQRQPDLIILDVMMPVMDGLNFLETMRRSTTLKDIPVIFMTAKVQSHEIEEYYALGVLGVISKPFSPVGLPDQIREIWNSVAVV